MWRALNFLIVAFWLLMTVWLVRSVYYPEGAGFAEVPPKVILKSFLEQGGLINTLHVFHRDQKIGHAAVNPRRLGDGTKGNDYAVLISGLLEKGALPDVEGPVSWHLEIRLENMDTWGGASGRVRMLAAATMIDFAWPKAQSIPTFSVRKNGAVVADNSLLQPLMAQMMMSQGGTPTLPNGTPVNPQSVSDMISVKSREGTMKIAGQRRKGYVLEFAIMDHYNVKAFFTEAGELALVELPDGYRLLEPVIYGLIPDDPDEETTQ